MLAGVACAVTGAIVLHPQSDIQRVINAMHNLLLINERLLCIGINLIGDVLLFREVKHIGQRYLQECIVFPL